MTRSRLGACQDRYTSSGPARAASCFYLERASVFTLALLGEVADCRSCGLDWIGSDHNKAHCLKGKESSANPNREPGREKQNKRSGARNEPHEEHSSTNTQQCSAEDLERGLPVGK